MTGYGKLARIKVNTQAKVDSYHKNGMQKIRMMIGMMMSFVLAGCGLIPLPTSLPVEIPGIPSDWAQLQGLMGELGIPDISALGNVPGLEALSGLQTPPGAISFQGPLELGIIAGEVIPGTDIRFVGADESGDVANFEIAGFRAPRQLGDSLDFDGKWPGIEGVSYQLRLRLYQISDGAVRAAGVQRVVIENISPLAAEVSKDSGGHTLRFPHSVTSDAGELFPGMTLAYGGEDERGAIVQGLPDGEYPYRKLGDSIEWAGMLTPNIPVVYHLRLLYYQEANATVGGVVIVSLPGP